ncbi:hypothetical protein [Geosporobacter ferrireducens]|uniref:Uncharacterized protein n=1 Tax=Geosporobacter ferrireducens TaxID=1424294 RepID=A0A1D8GCD9_9FIRM|nr:hypothetical protein [Geosporobacter ferrireducens]AOT68550.1 hypothetical protein Gferi_02435 [Geosporobacter ferrireducens]
MSAFLGPIHHWLFKKIKLHEDLEKNLLSRYEEIFGGEILKIKEKAETKYGSPMENKPLDQMIDTGNIHGWLQSKITTAETRQAAILTGIFQQYGNKALEIALEEYKKQGKESGLDACNNVQVDSAPAIYKALNNYLLDGMPCDNVNNITIAEPDLLQWKNIHCLHRGYWETVGANPDTFYQLRSAWIASFVENANEHYLYTVKTETSNGNPVFVHEIQFK